MHVLEQTGIWSQESESNSVLLFSSNCITELCVPINLPEVKLLDVSKNSVDKVSPDFLTGCPKLETLNISVNKICECGGEMNEPSALGSPKLQTDITGGKRKSTWVCEFFCFFFPGSLSHLSSKITTLKLANNNFTEVSKAILNLPK